MSLPKRRLQLQEWLFKNAPIDGQKPTTKWLKLRAVYLRRYYRRR